jgi:putative ABC transport system permease protein
MGWRRFIFRTWWDRERRRELESYIEIETDANIARGLPPDLARHAAYRKLGNPTLVREEIYRMNTIRLFETFWQDLRYGGRLLRMNPAFTIIALLSLSLGVGANTAIFQLIDAVRLRPLPVEDPQRLVEVRIADTRGRTGRFLGQRPMLTNAIWEQVRDRQQAFAGMAAWGGGSFDLSAGGESRYATVMFVSGQYFEMLGVRPAAGRLLGPADDVKGCGAPQAVISHAFARREFGGMGAVGQKVRLAGQAYDVAGVTEPGFFGVDVGRTFDVAVPLCAEARLRGDYSLLEVPEGWFLSAVGRLKPGVTDAQATAQLQAISAPIFRETAPPTFSAEDAQRYSAFTLAAYSARSGVSSIRSTYDEPLWALLGTTGLVLLIACANLANLMLARATARGREIAVRLAIGASRARVVRQLMSESLLLALMGALCGAVLAGWMSGFLVAFLDTTSNQIYVPLTLDWRVFGFAGALAVLTCVLFGLAPALRATHAAPVAAMKTGARGVTDSRDRAGLRRALVVMQVALSLVLVVGALLFVRSLTNLRSTDLGFTPDGLLVVALDLRRAPVPKDRRIDQYNEIRRRLQQLPTVAAVAEVGVVPISGSMWNNNILIDGKVQAAFPYFNRVSPGYFSAMQTPLVAGRDFAGTDSSGAPKVAVVDESFARTYFGSANPVGRSFQIEEAVGAPRPHYQIVGVVKNTKYFDVRDEAGPIAYLAAAQESNPGPSMQLMVRARGPMAAAREDVRQAIVQFHPAIGIQLDAMDSQIRGQMIPERLMATLSAFFGGLATLIAMIGLYGVMSYMVTRRRSEIGIRMALGADRVTVVRMVMRESAILVTLGAVLGLSLAVLAARWVSTLLFGLTPRDPLTLALSTAALVVVAACASYLPARRAARVSPMTALRE